MCTCVAQCGFHSLSTSAYLPTVYVRACLTRLAYPTVSCCCQLEEYKRRCTDLEAELAVQEIGAESNAQQVRGLPAVNYSCHGNLQLPLLHSRFHWTHVCLA